jgi:hypothetical protein
VEARASHTLAITMISRDWAAVQGVDGYSLLDRITDIVTWNRLSPLRLARGNILYNSSKPLIVSSLVTIISTSIGYYSSR